MCSEKRCKVITFYSNEQIITIKTYKNYTVFLQMFLFLPTFARIKIENNL